MGQVKLPKNQYITTLNPIVYSCHPLDIDDIYSILQYIKNKKPESVGNECEQNSKTETCC